MCNAKQDCLAKYYPDTVAEVGCASIHDKFCPTRTTANTFNNWKCNAELVFFAAENPLPVYKP